MPRPDPWQKLDGRWVNTSNDGWQKIDGRWVRIPLSQRADLPQTDRQKKKQRAFLRRRYFSRLRREGKL